MASDRARDVKADLEEEEEGFVTPSLVSPGFHRANTIDEDEATPPAAVPNDTIRWLSLSTNAMGVKDHGMTNGSEEEEVSPLNARHTAPPSKSFYHSVQNQDYFALQIPRTGSIHPTSPSYVPPTQRSSGSLKAMSEHGDSGSPRSLRRAPSNLSTRSTGLGRRISHSKSSSTSFLPAKSPNSEHPVYPDQSFASLHHQFFASRPAPVLRTRSSNPSPNILYSDISSSSRPSRTQPNPSPAAMTAGNTPISSPGLFSPTASRPHTSDRSGDEHSRSNSPLLHPAHSQKPKVTHTAEIDRDLYTGNKYVNDYEILGELGRGEHGKVKLGRRMGEETNVAIKIVPRYSKRRRLGKLGAPEDETKREVAVLKKARHPNVVSLLEVIDDPAKNKVYLVLEFVEHGEIKWRKKAPREILGINNTRIDQERNGITLSLEPTEAQQLAVAKTKRRHVKLEERTRAAGLTHVPKWSLEHSADTDEESESPDLSKSISRQFSRSNIPSRTCSHDEFGLQLDAPLSSSLSGTYPPDTHRNRAMSIAASTASHMSSEFNLDEDSDQYGYVPALTFDECRRAIRDTLLGLEFLHFIGIIHRDIKPMNLLVSSNNSVKISDFGVSYLGRPVSDEEEGKMVEAEAETLDDPKELAKSVGTPAFWAPELCYDITDPAQVAIFEKDEKSKITQALDLWALGITLYCMVYARLPFFQHGHEMSLYDAICKSDVFIPRTRLVPVDTTNPGPVSFTTHAINSGKRLDYDLKFEVVPEPLRDFIRQLLTKNPDKRITVAGAKKHPWVLEGIADPSQWIKVATPGQKRKSDILYVDEKEMSHAVVKRSIVERAISGVTRIAGNLLGRRDGRKRTRSTATSTSASSDSIASPSASSGSTVGKAEKSKEGRRTSLRGDEMIAAALKASREGNEHPLAQSQTASPDERHMPSYFGDLSDTKAYSAGATPGNEQMRRPQPERAVSTVSTAESVKTIRASHYSKRTSVLDPPPQESPMDTSNLLDAASTSLHGIFSGARKGLAGVRTRERRPFDKARSASASRPSSENDAYAEASILLSNASASGDIELPEALRDDPPALEKPRLRLNAINPAGDRRISLFQPPESSETAFEQAQAMNRRRYIQEAQLEAEKAASRPESKAADYECPPSPDDVVYLQKVKTAMHEASPTSAIATLPSASTIASSEDFGNSSVSQSISNQSIGAISGASSPPTDPFLLAGKEQQIGQGSENLPDFMRTADTVTAHGRPIVAAGRSLEQQAEYDAGEDGDNEEEEEDDYSSGDEGLLMMGSGSKKILR